MPSVLDLNNSSRQLSTGTLTTCLCATTIQHTDHAPTRHTVSSIYFPQHCLTILYNPDHTSISDANRVAIPLGAMGRDWPIACSISALLDGGIITYRGPAGARGVQSS